MYCATKLNNFVAESFGYKYFAADSFTTKFHEKETLHEKEKVF